MHLSDSLDPAYASLAISDVISLFRREAFYSEQSRWDVNLSRKMRINAVSINVVFNSLIKQASIQVIVSFCIPACRISYSTDKINYWILVFHANNSVITYKSKEKVIQWSFCQMNLKDSEIVASCHEFYLRSQVKYRFECFDLIRKYRTFNY